MEITGDSYQLLTTEQKDEENTKAPGEQLDQPQLPSKESSGTTKEKAPSTQFPALPGHHLQQRLIDRITGKQLTPAPPCNNFTFGIKDGRDFALRFPSHIVQSLEEKGKSPNPN